MGLGIGWLLAIIALIAGFMASFGQTASLIIALGSMILLMISSVALLLFLGTRAAHLAFHKKRIALMTSIKRVRPSFFAMRPFSRFASSLDRLCLGDQRFELRPCACFGIMTAIVIVLAIISWPLCLIAVSGSFCTWALTKGKKNLKRATSTAMRESLRQSWLNYPDLIASGPKFLSRTKAVGI